MFFIILIPIILIAIYFFRLHTQENHMDKVAVHMVMNADLEKANFYFDLAGKECVAFLLNTPSISTGKNISALEAKTNLYLAAAARERINQIQGQPSGEDERKRLREHILPRMYLQLAQEAKNEYERK